AGLIRGARLQKGTALHGLHRTRKSPSSVLLLPPWHGLTASAWRSPPLVEPRAVRRHLRALRLRCKPLARRGFIALVRCTPPQFDAVVYVVRHLKIRCTINHIFERERPRRSIAARIGKLPRSKLRREHAL